MGSEIWKWPSSTRIMGILNVTPDSFSDGGDFSDLDKAVQHTKEMVDWGADIIDIGGQSTRPGAEEVSVEEELRRVIPVIKKIREHDITVPISVDTYRSEVALAAVSAGANMINDVTGGMYDPKMFQVMADLRVPVCLMHMRGTPKTMNSLTLYENGNVMGEITKVIAERCKNALDHGVYRWNLIVDPGIGFAKTSEQSFSLLKNLNQMTREGSGLAGLPILVGPSRKRFIAEATSKSNPKERVWGTAAACTACVAGGASIIRVHDVMEMKDVVAVADRLFKN
jgi:dihydroneopterin aldolase / 2-amino-4-hydroxy-6-hydroxymethyldihydropteridine diphosphokinase / dihydropteroate synthase